MDKQRLCIERELMSNSAQIIWDLISTDSGLARWVADSVTQDGEQLTFVWGELWSHHEVRKGTIVEKISWDDEDGPDNFFELRMDKSHITNDYVLTITDFAWEDEVDSLKTIWNDNLARLRNSSGI